jgi:hypothetical protein
LDHSSRPSKPPGHVNERSRSSVPNALRCAHPALLPIQAILVVAPPIPPAEGNGLAEPCGHSWEVLQARGQVHQMRIAYTRGVDPAHGCARSGINEAIALGQSNVATDYMGCVRRTDEIVDGGVNAAMLVLASGQIGPRGSIPRT